MNGDILIKSRKVFVENNIVEYSENCPHCTSKGLQNKLRYFYLSLEEAIYKCENANCLYPFERFIFKNLINNTVYYYEEVLDGGRELFFRVPLDGQNDLQSSHPLSTKLFCDNQRNPDIEDYNCDFSDLFNDFDDDVETSAVERPSSTENPDALEFLNEIDVKTDNRNTNHELNEIGIDSIIADILDESPTKCSPNKALLPPPSQLQFTAQNAESSPSKTKPKLLKCIQHLGKVKKTQSRKVSERTKQPFTSAILKARKGQTKLQSDPVSLKQEPENQQISQQKSKPNSEPVSTEAFLKSTNHLRPTELARKLSSLKSVDTNSEFLRQYMKVKEEKLFADEPKPESFDRIKSQSVKTVTITNEVNSNQNILPDLNTESKTEHMEQSNSSAAQPQSTKKTRKSTKKVQPISIATTSSCEVKNKRKSRSKKSKKVHNEISVKKEEHCDESVKLIGDCVVAKQEPNNDAVVGKTTKKKPVSSKRKPVKRNQTTASGLGELDQNNGVTIKTELKKVTRKRKTTSNDADVTHSIEMNKNENVKPAKRQRKSKYNSEAKAEQGKSIEIKTKRSRTTKSRAHPIKVEQQSLPAITDDNKFDSQVKPEFNEKLNTSDTSSCFLPTVTESEICGFEPLIKNESPSLSCAQQKVPARTTKRKSTQNANEHTNTKKTPSKRSKKSALDSKVKRETCEKPSTSQKDAAIETLVVNSMTESNSYYIIEALQLGFADSEKSNNYVNVYGDFNNSVNPSDNPYERQPIPTNASESSQLIHSTLAKSGSAEIKSKRTRTTKSKAIQIKVESTDCVTVSQANSDVNEELNAADTITCFEPASLYLVQQQKVPSRTKRKSMQNASEHSNMEKISTKRSKKSALDSKVKEEECEEPSTSQKDGAIEKLGVKSMTDNLMVIPADDSSHKNEPNSCPTAEKVQQSVVCEITDDNKICINQSEIIVEPKSTNTPASSQMIQPKLFFQDDGKVSIDQLQGETSNETTNHYYRRKVFKMEKEPSFQVEKLLGDWDDSDCEQQIGHTVKVAPDLGVEFDEVISVTSETSDSSCGFVGEPYQIQPNRNQTQHE